MFSWDAPVAPGVYNYMSPKSLIHRDIATWETSPISFSISLKEYPFLCSRLALFINSESCRIRKLSCLNENFLLQFKQQYRWINPFLVLRTPFLIEIIAAQYGHRVEFLICFIILFNSLFSARSSLIISRRGFSLISTIN